MLRTWPWVSDLHEERTEGPIRLVKHAGLSAEDERCLEKAVVIAFSPINTGSFCEEFELSEEQLSFLRLGMARQILA